MAQRTFGRALAAVALTATLTLALPAQGEAAPLNKPVNLWEWVSGLLEEKIAAVWPSRVRQPTARSGATKQGGCIDPNGCTPSSQSTAAPQRPLCTRWDDQGGCIDPNG